MLSKKMEKALNDQLNAELESAYIYLALAAYFEDKNLDGFGQWMQAQAQEEVGHGMKFYNFILSRGGRVRLGAIDAPRSDWDSPLKGFTAAYKHEQKITGKIHGLVELASKENDTATHQFLMWFVEEQVEEEDSVGKIVARLEMAGDSPSGLLFMDRELGGRGAE